MKNSIALFEYINWLEESGRITNEEHTELLNLIQDYENEVIDEVTDELYNVL